MIVECLSFVLMNFYLLFHLNYSMVYRPVNLEYLPAKETREQSSSGVPNPQTLARYQAVNCLELGFSKWWGCSAHIPTCASNGWACAQALQKQWALMPTIHTNGASHGHTLASYSCGAIPSPTPLVHKAGKVGELWSSLYLFFPPIFVTFIWSPHLIIVPVIIFWLTHKFSIFLPWNTNFTSTFCR